MLMVSATNSSRLHNDLTAESWLFINGKPFIKKKSLASVKAKACFKQMLNEDDVFHMHCLNKKI